MGRWEDYLGFLDAQAYSLGRLALDLSPKRAFSEPRSIAIKDLCYDLWPFQRKVLEEIAGDALILGLPTGMGKTYLAGAHLKRLSADGPIRVLFLTPTVPLGVQQALFARRMLNIDDAFLVSGQIPPALRRELDVWNAPFVVSTPQVFANDILSPFDSPLREARMGKPVLQLACELKDAGFTFPYSVVVADECQGYIGETDGHSILIAAKASGSRILALSATPQLHAPYRLEELKRIFDHIQVFSIEDPEIKKYMPERILKLVPIAAPDNLLAVYSAFGRVVADYARMVEEAYGHGHSKERCREHGLCGLYTALRVMRFRLVEDGASSVMKYGAWRVEALRSPVEELDGRSVYEAYRRALEERFNHKIYGALGILEKERFEKVIVFIESVEAAKQLGGILQRKFGMEDVAILVGKGSMSMERQASSLMHFRERAKILVTTSVGEEGLDIPAADIEVWVDPPSNPKKWIQRFGRILHQPGGRRSAVTYALITTRTHERGKLLGVMRRVEEVYGFTQRLLFTPSDKLPKGQRTMSQFLPK